MPEKKTEERSVWNQRALHLSAIGKRMYRADDSDNAQALLVAAEEMLAGLKSTLAGSRQ